MKNPSQSATIIVIAGPTASGKTACAVELACTIGGELIGADSVQVYRKLNVGSAKPTQDELRGISHHLIDVADLDEPFDAARYVSLADSAIASVRARGRIPIVVGGTGLYLRSLRHGLAPGLASDPNLRAELNARASRGAEERARMHAELRTVDPEYAAKISWNDPVRIVRAIEVYRLSGEPLTVHHRRHSQQPPRYRTLFLALDCDWNELRARIETRTDAMLRKGWLDEVRALLASGYPPELKPLRSVGYAQLVRHLRADGNELDGVRTEIVRETIAFAKRQRTWFRGERDLHWVRPEALGGAEWHRRIRDFTEGNASEEMTVPPDGCKR